MNPTEQLAAHRAAMCEVCLGLGYEDGIECPNCGGCGYHEEVQLPTYAEHAALLRFAVAVHKALDAKVADGMCVLHVNDARNAVNSDFAALEGGHTT